ncbi:MAG: phosphatase PAP2 family protein [Thermoflexibacter sp.]|nr:phosphatase PAP2 family protein [Thermoflexibacter sp.]
MLESLDEIDKTIFLFLNGLHQDWLDPIMQFITGTVSWIPFYILILAFLFWKFKKYALVILIAIALTITAADQLTSSLMKPTFQRLRPCYDEQIRLQVYNYVGCGGQFGFASSHAANTFALAMMLWIVCRGMSERRKIAYLMFSWAGLVAYSRIYVGVHYLGDVLVGGIIGIILASVISFLFKQMNIKPFAV